MREIKKSVLTISVVGIVLLLLGSIAYSVGLGDLLPKEGLLASFIGTSAIGFGMKCCLVGVLGTVFFVPSIRSQFSGSYSSGSTYKSAHKKGRGGGI